MIKKYNQYIKETINIDIDPYGEEDWEEDNLPTILQIAKRTGKQYDQIIQLYCHFNQLTSLEGIEKLTNLKALYCSHNQLNNLNDIENLTNLIYLSCSNNRLTSLEGIENLTNLKLLWCVNNQLTSLEGIENLINLKYLSCSNNLFSNDYKKMLKNYCKNKNIELNI